MMSTRVNTALAAYGAVRAATNLAQNGLVTAGPMVSVDIDMSGAKMSRTSYAPNIVALYLGLR